MDFGVSENKRIFRGLTSPNLLFLCSVRKLREWHISYPGTQARDLVAFFMSSLSFIPYLWRCSVTNMYPFVSFLSVILSTFLQLHTATSVHICNVSHWLPEFAASRLSQSHLTHCRQIQMYIFKCIFDVYLIMSLLCFQFQLLPIVFRMKTKLLTTYFSSHMSSHSLPSVSQSYWNICTSIKRAYFLASRAFYSIIFSLLCFYCILYLSLSEHLSHRIENGYSHAFPSDCKVFERRECFLFAFVAWVRDTQ